MQVQRLTLDNVLIDGNLQLSNYYNARGYPTTLFLDADGRLRDMHIGELSRATLAERLQRIKQLPEAPAWVAGLLAHRGETVPVLDLRSEEHTSELQSLMRISYAVFCLKKKNPTRQPI